MILECLFPHTLSPLLSADDDTSDHLGEYCYLPSHVMKLQGAANLHVCVHPAG